MAPEGVLIRRAAPEDVGEMVRVHLAAFPGFFLSELGPRFLTELYAAFTRDEQGLALVALQGDRAVGFVLGTAAPERFFRTLLKRRAVRFVLGAVPAVARRPVMVSRRLLGALTYRGEKPTALEGAALLSSIAVDPAREARGLGRALVHAFCEQARHGGAASVYLTTDRDGNDRVNNFYRSIGFELESSFLKPPRRYMNRYVKRLAPVAPA